MSYMNNARKWRTGGTIKQGRETNDVFDREKLVQAFDAVGLQFIPQPLNP